MSRRDEAMYYTSRSGLDNRGHAWPKDKQANGRATVGVGSPRLTQVGRFSGIQNISDALIIPRAEHSLSRALISDNALKVLTRLKDAGYAALLVGGCVRDLLLGREPKDFDVVT